MKFCFKYKIMKKSFDCYAMPVKFIPSYFYQVLRTVDWKLFTLGKRLDFLINELV